jgi:4a-hydroxytetrahydrobiopterin dehydratase
MTKITPEELVHVDGLDDWRYVLGAIHAEFEVTPFARAAALVTSIGEASDAADHHPEVALRYPGRVRVSMHSHDSGGITQRDVSLARTVSALANDAGATSHAAAVQGVEIAIDTMDADRIRPFWQAVLGYARAADGSLFDPTRQGPALWFQQMSEPRTERQRFHLDVSVPHDVAEARVAAAVAAGGRLVSDEFARSWWILADADGNEACVCTWQDRTPSV